MSANSLRLFVCCLPLVLGACSNGELPKWLTGEPSKAEIEAATAQSPVPMPPPPPKDAPYPNLADVPPKPVPKLDKAARDMEMKTLQEENVRGQAEVSQFTKDNPK